MESGCRCAATSTSTELRPWFRRRYLDPVAAVAASPRSEEGRTLHGMLLDRTLHVAEARPGRGAASAEVLRQGGNGPVAEAPPRPGTAHSRPDVRIEYGRRSTASDVRLPSTTRTSSCGAMTSSASSPVRLRQDTLLKCHRRLHPFRAAASSLTPGIPGPGPTGRWCSSGSLLRGGRAGQRQLRTRAWRLHEAGAGPDRARELLDLSGWPASRTATPRSSPAACSSG